VVDPKNRFNRLTSKEWLPFQKSWCNADDIAQLYSDTIRFFVPAENARLYYYGPELKLVTKICKQEKVKLHNEIDAPIDFAFLDLRDVINEQTSIKIYEQIKKDVLNKVLSLYNFIEEKKFLSIWLPNISVKENYYPFAWDLGLAINGILSLKDEKIACINLEEKSKVEKYFHTSQQNFYCLFFKKDDLSTGIYTPKETLLFSKTKQTKGASFSGIPAWYILKPAPRKKNEVLHPAKYPEALVTMHVEQFTKENEIVFDPMSGTGSTQVAALQLNRQAYGTELSDFFAEIAQSRIEVIIAEKKLNGKIWCKDARKLTKRDLPKIDYIITSPPYWDMLNMKGAENQAKRIEKGLQTNYSDSTEDMGNINDYDKFLKDLVALYFKIIENLKPGGFITIVVKNIKKKGRNYPLAWDLANALQEKLILCPETFWCQDDINLAPYGYRYTFVSNTFHQYCLTFQKAV
jgi:DNA modification methylase